MQWHGAKRRPPQCLLSAIPPQLHPPHRTKQIPSAPGFSSCQKSLVVNWWSIGNKNSRGFNVFHHLTLTRSLEPSTNLWSQIWESLGHRFSSLGCMNKAGWSCKRKSKGLNQTILKFGWCGISSESANPSCPNLIHGR